MNKGVTLIELLLAVVIVTFVGFSMALLFPKSFKAMASNRIRIAATGLASAKMDEIKGLPYPKIPRTAAGTSGFYFSSTADPGCDCKTVNWGTLPFSATQYGNGTNVSDSIIADGITFNRQTCINLVEQPVATWIPHCLPPPLGPVTGRNEYDPTLSNILGKNVRVHVSWTIGNETNSMDMESLATGS